MDLRELLEYLQLEGGYTTRKSNGQRSWDAYGRLGAEVPTKVGNLGLGVSGWGYGDKQTKQFGLGGLDVSYRKGPHNLRLDMWDPKTLKDFMLMYEYGKEF
jgi:hypothetical protein